VRRFAEYSNQYPWQWEPAEVESFIGSLSIAPSTTRSYQNCLVQALFDAAGQPDRDPIPTSRGRVDCDTDSAMLKTVYAFGSRRQEAVGLDVSDWRRNSKVPSYGRFGAVFVRFGKSSNGSPPKRRTVFHCR
jgi:integrase/recombinase XerD